uniref:Uncharacterized protein n=1 Tax=Nelumbo nucifera TaxID=4432 RepID=A0A822XFL6_NELNU|nr:TPA_asm: hypothetical protein HUJ06_020155 [Nelumbo nucifera]
MFWFHIYGLPLEYLMVLVVLNITARIGKPFPLTLEETKKWSKFVSLIKKVVQVH